MAKRCFSTPDATSRLAAAHDWLAGHAADENLLVVAASADAASELLRRAVLDSKVGAAFGWQRATLGQLAAQLAAKALAEMELVPVSRLAAEAVVARVVHGLVRAGGLGRFRNVASMPGFVRAATRTFEELRMARAVPAMLGELAPDLRELMDEILAELSRRNLTDRAQVFELATRAAREGDRDAHPQLGLNTLLLDVPLWSAAEANLAEALIRVAPETLATVPAGDARTERRLLELGFSVEPASPISKEPHASSLQRMQTHLFEDAIPEERAFDDGVVVLSAPGEGRECVEIVRRLHAAARRGVAFDRMAILLHSPDEYRTHLEEALRRADIPAHFAAGAVEPDPTGRAFAALLTCAAEGLSARRFAEYLSLGEVPDGAGERATPDSTQHSERWVASDVELVPRVVAEAELAAARTEAQGDPKATALTHATLRRWEKLIADAAVIGGLERWKRRLASLEQELDLKLAEDLAADLTEREEAGSQRVAHIQRERADLATLQSYALPLLGALAALPDRATWGEWSDALGALAARALRHPGRVVSVLAELAPMAEVGPVDLEEVRLVLSQRLLEASVPASSIRHGKVYVAPTDAARGLSFEVVCIPGLAEKLFPREIREEPLLLDHVRRALALAHDLTLATNDDRVREERLALQLAVGASTRELVLSYPRLDSEKSRPRVPSFYTLEALRAGEGVLPGFAELAARAETVSLARVGWPAPGRPEDAIDDAEHDLALLDSILRLDEKQRIGTARYLLGANPHLGRALRFRARRWIRRWTPADGLVEPDDPAAKVLAQHRLAARSYSATALENYAKCPYRFFLQAIMRLTPREVPEAVDEMNPLQRGSLVHEVQFELYCQLNKEGLFPVSPENLVVVQAALDAVLDGVAARFHEELAPAIDRVWDDGIATLRADLREWLRRASEDASGFVPVHFELSFGLPKGRERDANSRAEPVPLDAGLTLRGSIDLVERDAAGRLRVTDHKTGKVRMEKISVVKGGTALQPVLYALAAEKLFPKDEVVEGRLYYCTTAGGFEERSVPLDARARRSAEVLSAAIDGALAAGFLPAYPVQGACQFCDYRNVCGPYEELRTQQKPEDKDTLRALAELRALP